MGEWKSDIWSPDISGQMLTVGKLRVEAQDDGSWMLRSMAPAGSHDWALVVDGQATPKTERAAKLAAVAALRKHLADEGKPQRWAARCYFGKGGVSWADARNCASQDASAAKP